VFADGPVFEKTLRCAGRAPRTRWRAVVLISVERALPLISPGYDLGLSEDENARYLPSHFEVSRVQARISRRRRVDIPTWREITVCPSQSSILQAPSPHLEPVQPRPRACGGAGVSRKS